MEHHFALKDVIWMGAQFRSTVKIPHTLPLQKGTKSVHYPSFLKRGWGDFLTRTGRDASSLIANLYEDALKKTGNPAFCAGRSYERFHPSLWRFPP